MVKHEIPLKLGKRRSKINEMLSIVLNENFLEVQCEIYAKILELKKLKRRANIAKKERTIIAILMIHCHLGELSCLEFMH